ncbi:Beta-glucosidase 22 [Acorus calamus]|uniref:Beta-glucosidase 22 n=1 Tax=Acorus calamus TaxID=4465 RepID=A0AAV9CTN7_ACOCL|nr:Beta-glucosidase 22 [Acorus calamus]
MDKRRGYVAAGGYYKYKEDVEHMRDVGLEAYRFSISWSRLIPNGRGAINRRGLDYYNNVIDELVKHGIQPHVTLLHIDRPQIIEDEYAGFLSRRFVEDFTAYADVCFREFGDRVRHWTTFNEPNMLYVSAYDTGDTPPRRCSYPFGHFNCTAGNSTTEPYIVMHNILLAHAEAAALYKTKYQVKQNGWIGINVCTNWMYPYTNSIADIRAAQRSMDFKVGWMMNPLVFGDYPDVMKEKAGSRLPRFTKAESERLMSSFDFIAINHYISLYVKDDTHNSTTSPLHDYYDDASVKIAGLGMMTSNNLSDNLNDMERVDFLKCYIGAMLDAVRDGSNTRGYFVWSFVDVYEIAYELIGLDVRFGLYHVDFEDENMKREPKLSANWDGSNTRGYFV